MVERRSAVALYRQVADGIKQRIRDGELPPGAELPGEVALAEEYRVGRDVVRDALHALRSEGVVVTRRGRRSTVRRAGPVAELSAPAAAQITARMPTADERRRLDIDEGVPLIVVRAGGRETQHPADRVVFRTPPGWGA